MVYALPFIAVLLAHGADPTPLDWDEALANLVKFGVTFLLIGFMSYPILEPLFRDQDEEGGDIEGPTKEPSRVKSETVGWVLVAGALVLGLGWWLARTSLVEVMTEEPTVKEDHAHTQEVGGQVAMWADFHAEVVRVESGEVRIYLRDSYNRDIAARFSKPKSRLWSRERRTSLPPLSPHSTTPIDSSVCPPTRKIIELKFQHPVGPPP